MVTITAVASRGDTPTIIFLSRQMKHQLEVLEQGLVQNKLAVGKPRAMGLPTANVSCFWALKICRVFTLWYIVFYSRKELRFQVAVHPSINS